MAEKVFDHQPDARADRARAAWLLDPENAYYAWSDQMVQGKARGSKYYPRGVTAWLWLGDRKRTRATATILGRRTTATAPIPIPSSAPITPTLM